MIKENTQARGLVRFYESSNFTNMKPHKSDKGLIIAVFILLIAGLVILFNASRAISQEDRGNTYYYFFHQLIYGGIVGVGAFLIAQKINYKFWRKIALILFFSSLVLSVLVFVPNLGYDRAGAQRWLSIGPLSFQPSEFLKLAFVIYLAAFFSKKERHFNTLIPFLAIMASLYFIAIDLSFSTLIWSASALTSLMGLFSSAFFPHPHKVNDIKTNKQQRIVFFVMFIFFLL